MPQQHSYLLLFIYLIFLLISNFIYSYSKPHITPTSKTLTTSTLHLFCHPFATHILHRHPLPTLLQAVYRRVCHPTIPAVHTRPKKVRFSVRKSGDSPPCPLFFQSKTLKKDTEKRNIFE